MSDTHTDIPALTSFKRIVLKIGSALLVDEQSGQIRDEWLRSLAQDIASFHQNGQEVLIVSSGAVAAGHLRLGLNTSPKNLKLEDKQAAAAVGQIKLAHEYTKTLAEHSITAAQVLLTPDDTESRDRHLNARATLNALLKLKAIPIINENDTIATDEIRFGDNDRLAARVAQMMEADLLILLSDIDGLYTQNPRKHQDAEHIPVIQEITPEIEAMAESEGSSYSSGGMASKLAAAKIALQGGCHMIIAKGNIQAPLSALTEGAVCSWFLSAAEPRTARKKWIAGHLKPAGSVQIDHGAAQALTNGKSLLAAGITGVTGTFQRGDLIVIYTQDGIEIGKGLAAYSSEDTQKIMGRKSDEFEEIIGFIGRDELIHRDDLVMS